MLNILIPPLLLLNSPKLMRHSSTLILIINSEDIFLNNHICIVKEYIQTRVRKLILRFGGCSCLGGWENKNQNFKKQMSHLT